MRFWSEGAMWRTDQEAMEIEGEATTRRIWKLHKLCHCEGPHAPCEGGALTKQSAFYPTRMRQQISLRWWKKFMVIETKPSRFYMNATEECDMDALKPYMDQEVQKTAGETSPEIGASKSAKCC